MRKLIQYSIFLVSCSIFEQHINMLCAQGEIASGNVKTKIQSFYIGDDGGVYYVTADDNKLYWVGEHPGQLYCHVVSGIISGSIAKCEWTSSP